MKVVFEGEGVGGEIEVGLPEFIPSEALAGLAGVGAEEGVGGGIDHVVAAVDLFASPERGKELVVFDLIHVLFLTGLGPMAPKHLSLVVFGVATAGADHGGVGTGDAIDDFVVNPLDLALGDVAEHIAGIFVGDSVMVVNVAWIGARDFASSAYCGDGLDVVHGPGDFVGGVNRLLQKGAAGEPVEVDPVGDLPFDHTHTLGLDGVVGERAHGAGEVSAVDGFDATEFAGGDLGVGLDDSGMVAPAESVLDGESLRLRFHHGGKNGTEAGGIDGHGLFDKHVEARFDGGGDVAGAEAGSGGQDYDVDAGGDDFLITIDAGELAFGGDLSTLAEERDVLQAAIDGGLEGIACGPKFDVRVGFEGFSNRSCSASSAANEADLDGVVVAGLCFRDVRHSNGGESAGGGGGLEDLAASGRIWHDLAMRGWDSITN